ncbi:hypothetical protein L0Y40_03175 [Candidatus Wolfebacteria bacterium]|nr:hypothetical protein [Candidatus Wolfebacteria bacterium]
MNIIDRFWDTGNVILVFVLKDASHVDSCFGRNQHEGWRRGRMHEKCHRKVVFFIFQKSKSEATMIFENPAPTLPLSYTNDAGLDKPSLDV